MPSSEVSDSSRSAADAVAISTVASIAARSWKHAGGSETSMAKEPGAVDDTLPSEISAHGYAGEQLVAELLNSEGKAVDKQTVSVVDDENPLSVRFQVKPEKAGVHFYRVRVAAAADLEDDDEQEDANSTSAVLASVLRLRVDGRAQGAPLHAFGVRCPITYELCSRAGGYPQGAPLQDHSVWFLVK